MIRLSVFPGTGNICEGAKLHSPSIDFQCDIRIIRPLFRRRSSVAEQRICNPLVVSSTLTAGSILNLCKLLFVEVFLCVPISSDKQVEADAQIWGRKAEAPILFGSATLDEACG